MSLEFFLIILTQVSVWIWCILEKQVDADILRRLAELEAAVKEK